VIQALEKAEKNNWFDGPVVNHQSVNLIEQKEAEAETKAIQQIRDNPTQLVVVKTTFVHDENEEETYTAYWKEDGMCQQI